MTGDELGVAPREHGRFTAFERGEDDLEIFPLGVVLDEVLAESREHAVGIDAV